MRVRPDVRAWRGTRTLHTHVGNIPCQGTEAYFGPTDTILTMVRSPLGHCRNPDRFAIESKDFSFLNVINNKESGLG